jgi:WD40 repeat protein
MILISLIACVVVFLSIWLLNRTRPIIAYSIKHRGSPIYSSDGNLIVSSNGTGQITLWNADTGEVVRNLNLDGHIGLVTVTAYSPDGLTIATGSADGTARIWDSLSGEELVRLTQGLPVITLNYSPDGRFLATADASGTYIWDASTGQQVRDISEALHSRVVAYSPDGSFIATSSEFGDFDSAIYIWDVETGNELRSFRQLESVTDIVWSPDGMLIVGTGRDSFVRIWKVAGGEEIARLDHRLRVVHQPVYDAAFSPDGNFLITAADYDLAIWDTTTWRLVQSFSYSDNVDSRYSYRHVSYSPSGQSILAYKTDRSGSYIETWLLPDFR